MQYAVLKGPVEDLHRTTCFVDKDFYWPGLLGLSKVLEPQPMTYTNDTCLYLVVNKAVIVYD